MLMRGPEPADINLDDLLGLRGRPSAVGRAPLPARCAPWPYGSTGAVVCARHGADWGACGRVAPDDPVALCPAG